MFADRGIPTKVILDSAVGAIMEEVDLCLVGAEGVMENGGIVNRVHITDVHISRHIINGCFRNELLTYILSFPYYWF